MKVYNTVVTHRNVMNEGFHLDEMNDRKIDAAFLDLPSP